MQWGIPIYGLNNHRLACFEFSGIEQIDKCLGSHIRVRSFEIGYRCSTQKTQIILITVDTALAKGIPQCNNGVKR